MEGWDYFFLSLLWPVGGFKARLSNPQVNSQTCTNFRLCSLWHCLWIDLSQNLFLGWFTQNLFKARLSNPKVNSQTCTNLSMLTFYELTDFKTCFLVDAQYTWPNMLHSWWIRQSESLSPWLAQQRHEMLFLENKINYVFSKHFVMIGLGPPSFTKQLDFMLWLYCSPLQVVFSSVMFLSIFCCVSNCCWVTFALHNVWHHDNVSDHCFVALLWHCHLLWVASPLSKEVRMPFKPTHHHYFSF